VLKVKMVLITICLVLVFISISYAEIDPESISALWLLDEGSGKLASDSSGKGNDATISGAEWADGKFGKALEFDGKDTAESKTFKNTAGEFNVHTYVLWAKQKGSGSEIPFNAGSARVMNVHFNESPGSLLVGYSGMAGDWIRVPNVITPDEWYHVGVTYDGKEMLAYLNGKVISQRDTSVSPPQEAGSFLMGRFLGGGYFYNGLIDDVCVFNVALAEDDINIIMQQGMKKY